MLVKPMDASEPTPPDDVAQYLLDGLDRQDADTLRSIAAYAERLADWRELQAAADLEDGDDEVVRESSEDLDDLPDDVPRKASVVVKEINDNRYEYYQWREGSTVKSQYKAPVNPSE